MESLGKFVNLFLTTDANALSVCLDDVSGIEIHFLWLKLKVATKGIIHLLNLLCPIGIARIRLTLMHQDSLDDTIFLGLLGQRHQSLVWIVVVSLEHSLHPTGSLVLHIVGNLRRHEALNLDAADGYMDDTNLDVLWKRSHKGTAKPVGRRQTSVWTTKGCRSLAPLAHLTAFVGEIDSRHEQETRAWAFQILSFRTGISLHVRLTKTEEDVEIRIYRRLHS